MLKGTYTFRAGGEVVSQVDNLITDAAKPIILDFLSGKTKSWAGSIAVGIDDTAASALNRYLNFESVRAPVSVIEPKYSTGQIIAKATLPLNMISQIYEVGLVSASLSGNEDPNNYIISFFNPDTDAVEGATPVAGRLGATSSQLTLATSPDDFSVEELSISLGNLSIRDKFRFAYEATNITNVTLRFYNADNNFRSFTFTAVAGFNVREFSVADVTGTGTFDEEISRVMIEATGGIGGTLVAEGLRFHRASLDADESLMSHAVLALPVAKDAGEEMDIEFTITFGGLSG